MSFTNQDIARYYELSESQYAWVWDLNRSHSLHYGYWDAHTKTLNEALLNINRVLSEKASISSNDLVLDAGCGVGGSSLWMASNIGCKVKAISLSPKQVFKANVFKSSLGLDSLVDFTVQDFTETAFESGSFDVVWAIESVCHAPVKMDFIREAFRLLKPGGRLIVADFFKQPGLQGEDAALIKRWAHGWAVDDFATIEDFTKDLALVGFNGIEVEDATENIKPSAKRLRKAYLPGKIAAFLYNLFHPKASGIGLKNLDTVKTQWQALTKGLWKYNIVKAKK